MQIGYVLKRLRKQLCLSQAAMAGTVISPSYYAKVERGESEIRARDLFDILAKNKIDFFEVKDLFVEEEFNKKSAEFIQEKIYSAFLKADLKQLNYLKKQIISSNYSIQLNLIVKIAIFLVMHGRSDTENRKQLISEVKQTIFDEYSTAIDSLDLIGASMFLFDFDDLELLLDLILRRVKALDQEEILVRMALMRALESYMIRCFEEGFADKVEEIAKIIEQLPPYHELFVFKFEIKYVVAVTNKDENEIKKLRGIIQELGYQAILDKIDENCQF